MTFKRLRSFDSTPPAMKKPGRRKTIGISVNRDRASNHTKQRGSKSRDLCFGEIRGNALRRDARLIENFIGDPVPDSRERGLVQQHRLDRRLARSDLDRQLSGARQGEEWIVAKTIERWFVSWVESEAQPTEAPRIGEREAGTVVELQLELQEARSLLQGGVELEGAGHSEVEDRPWLSIEFKPQMLAETARVPDRRAAQRLLDELRGSSAQDYRIRKACRGNDPPTRQRAERRLARGFDLRKLGQLLGAQTLDEGLHRCVPLRNGLRGAHDFDVVRTARSFDHRSLHLETGLVELLT